jgi:hypothetical protein
MENPKEFLMNNVHETPLSAWQHLCEFGGIELQGRDEGLDAQILSSIDPNAFSLDEALSNATMETFVRAFFRSLSPYIEMFRDILHFFEQADATQGKTQWTLRVGEIDLDLEHFRQWLDAWQQLVELEIEVPAIDFNAEWEIRSKLRNKFGYDAAEKAKSGVDAEIRKWLEDLEKGLYPLMPESLTPWKIRQPLSKLASIIYVKLQILNDLKLDHEGVKKLDRKSETKLDANGVAKLNANGVAIQEKKYKSDPSDSFALGTLLQNETDYWLRSASALLVFASNLPDTQIRDVGDAIDSITDKLPTRKFLIDASINGLDSVLSLPIWKQRYELYSVWIATEIIKALAGHDIEIHHDNGQIRFDFKETLIATIHSSHSPFRLIGEKKIPVKNPVGESRKENCQPDHQLWTTIGNVDICKMAIEVKHYNKPAKKKFIEVFKDYASAIPDGDVYLVNHGPAGNASANVPREIADRCFSVGDLTPLNLLKRKEFAFAIRHCAGEPRTLTNKSLVPTGARIFMIDVSGSMSQILKSDEMKNFLRDLMIVENASELVAVDTKIIERFEANDLGYEKLSCFAGGNTQLAESVSDLLEEVSSILVITDADGKLGLSEFEIITYPKPETIPMEIEVLVCKKLAERKNG